MTFLVAEIGVNWDGDFELVEEMMMKAKGFEFDAVKFQSFSFDLIKNHTEHQRLMKSTIDEKNIKEINQIAKRVGIEWFSTPMYVDAVDFLDTYVDRFKIRVADGKPLLQNESSNLINKILSKNKEVIISCESSPKNTKFYDNPKIKWLYCVSKYPCDLNDINFTKINDFDGYSNHCTNILAPLSAVILGASIIEIHITSDKTKNFVDNNVSFDYEEMNQLSNQIKLLQKLRR